VATQDELEQISFGRATGRYFARILSLLIFYIGYLMQPFTERKQALHDMISGTVVVVHGSGSRGLIVLVVILASFVPMVGILAAIALPAYQDYTIRAQVDDGIRQSQMLRAAVVQHYSTQGSFPPDTAALNLGRPVNSHYVSAITVQNGGIDIEYGSNAHRSIAGKHLGVQVLINPSGEAHFLCGGASAPAGFIIAASSSRPVTDLPNKSLPVSCRTPAGK
jgi:type IV pilus assembly protein PilA